MHIRPLYCVITHYLEQKKKAQSKEHENDDTDHEQEGKEKKSSETSNLSGSELEVYKWLNDTVKLVQYFQLFIDDGFDDMTQILTMTDEDLADIGITKKGHRRKILVCIGQKKNENNEIGDNIAHNNKEPGDNGEGFGYNRNDIEGVNVVNTGGHHPNANDNHDHDIQAANISRHS